MILQNIKLNEVFENNVKTYQTKPVLAARYKPGMENGYAVCFTYGYDEGYRFFDTLESAMQFYKEKPIQECCIDGQIELVKCKYYEPAPILYRRKSDEEKEYDISHGYAAQTMLCNDELNDHEVFFLHDYTWIIQELDGMVRVWDPVDLEETFFGKEYIYERQGEKYIKVVV